MPFSQASYLDVGLDDLREEAPETSADSQRVVYEDHRVEIAALYGYTFDPGFATSRPVYKFAERISIDSTAIRENVSTATVDPMECIAKYSGTSGGLTQRQFKQDAKAVYNIMLRDPQQHVITGFGR